MKKPRPTKRQKTSLSIDVQAWRALRIQAVLEGRPAYAILDELIAGYLRRKGGPR
jgi:hypothetical protein